MHQGSYFDMILTAYTCIFMSSKNSEVEPLSISDVRSHLLNNEFTKDQFRTKEQEIRKHIDYQNEVSTTFEFLMYYVKIWKTSF